MCVIRSWRTLFVEQSVTTRQRQTDESWITLLCLTCSSPLGFPLRMMQKEGEDTTLCHGTGSVDGLLAGDLRRRFRAVLAKGLHRHLAGDFPWRLGRGRRRRWCLGDAKLAYHRRGAGLARDQQQAGAPQGPADAQAGAPADQRSGHHQAEPHRRKPDEEARGEGPGHQRPQGADQ